MCIAGATHQSNSGLYWVDRIAFRSSFLFILALDTFWVPIESWCWHLFAYISCPMAAYKQLFPDLAEVRPLCNKKNLSARLSHKVQSTMYEDMKYCCNAFYTSTALLKRLRGISYYIHRCIDIGCCIGHSHVSLLVYMITTCNMERNAEVAGQELQHNTKVMMVNDKGAYDPTNYFCTICLAARLCRQKGRNGKKENFIGAESFWRSRYSIAFIIMLHRVLDGDT